jgi:hypothetical protein
MAQAVPRAAAPVTVQAALSDASDRTRILRGAVCGTVAAAVWAVQQPIDKRLFASRYDDVELLGKALTRGENWHGTGLSLHLLNGAVFGAGYSILAPSLPVPAPLRGPAVALTEHMSLWPLVALTDRLHPARNELPVLSGSRRAFWQAAYRHLLFGLVLGELERRVNRDPEPPAAEPEANYSSNGHGRIEHAVSVSASGPGASDAEADDR